MNVGVPGAATWSVRCEATMEVKRILMTKSTAVAHSRKLHLFANLAEKT